VWIISVAEVRWLIYAIVLWENKSFQATKGPFFLQEIFGGRTLTSGSAVEAYNFSSIWISVPLLAGGTSPLLTPSKI
jgi:hypothetical protein